MLWLSFLLTFDGTVCSTERLYVELGPAPQRRLLAEMKHECRLQQPYQIASCDIANVDEAEKPQGR